MFLAPFVRREMLTSVHCARVIRDRLIAVSLVTGVVAGCVVVCDVWGWDRSSISAAAWFALVAYGLTAFAQAAIAIGLVVGQVGPAIASERDRKSLDALLTTEFSSAEIVTGTMAAGLFRAANGLAATLPVVFMFFLGGVEPRLVLLAGAGLATTALAVAAISIVASVGAQTRSQAAATAGGLVFAWLVLPIALLTLKIQLWPGCPLWLTRAVLWLFDSSPFGVGMSLLGAMPRPGSVVERLLRMMALETAGAAALTLWAIGRLRPASRALFEAEGRIATLRALRLSRRRRPRPPCSDDPVLWNAIHANRRATVAGSIVGRLIGLVGLVLLALATSRFAVPAFAELAVRGYGPTPEASTVTDVDFFQRGLLGNLLRRSPAGPAPGQSRLEFNIALRQFSAFFTYLYVIVMVGGALEGVKTEQTRDTWPGLLATPLTGWEIVRAKMLGPVLRARGAALTMIGLWTVGLVAGALHPLGFLAAVTGLAVSAWFYAALGVSTALRPGGMERVLVPSAWVREPEPGRSRGNWLYGPERPGHPLSLPIRLVAALVGTFLLTASPVALAWSPLFSYEDVHSLVHSGRLPELGATTFLRMAGARTVAAAWLAGTTALAVGAFFVTRAMCRDFDVAVGRPARPRADVQRF